MQEAYCPPCSEYSICCPILADPPPHWLTWPPPADWPDPPQLTDPPPAGTPPPPRWLTHPLWKQEHCIRKKVITEVTKDYTQLCPLWGQVQGKISCMI